MSDTRRGSSTSNGPVITPPAQDLTTYDYERDIVPILEAKAAAEGKLMAVEDILRHVEAELTSVALYLNDRYVAYENEYWVRWEDIKARVLPLLEPKS